MALSVGTVVAGYRIEGVLGAGGMGTVYRARNPSLPRSDALKILSAEFSQDPQFRIRFSREAELAATLDHPNIVTVYSRGETDDGHLWIAMQYVAGSDADKEMRDGRMTPARAAHITTEVAKALDYAHRRQLLHRDVKPANFLLASEDERVFLADFGIARALDEAVGLTQTGIVMASVAYAAPETLGGLGVDHRADIYSLGCALYRMLTGKSPFARSGGMAAMVAAHLSEPPPRVTDAAPTLPPAIDAVIAKAMAKDPGERYQTARELAAAATEALDDTTTALRVTPPPPTTAAWPVTPTGTPPGFSGPPGPLTGPEAVTHPAGQYSGPQGATMPAPHTAPPGVPRQFAPPSHPSPPAGRARRRRWPVIAAAIATVIVIAAVVTGVLLTGAGDGEQAYQPQTFTHVHGSTEVTAAPSAVAAIGPGDGDAVLSLGMQPVAIGDTGSALPSWEQSAVTGKPTLLGGFLDTAAVAAAKPDLIIATGDLDDATYGKLAAIAPTITRPVQDAAAPWTWQNQLTWIGKILGRDAKATELINAARSQADDVKNQNPAFNGKSVEAVTVSDTGIGQILLPSNTAAYLESLGLRYDSDLTRTAADSGDSRPLQNPNLVYGISTDVLVVLRTDKAAGQGGFGGLPAPFSAYKGAMVIADSPDVLAALAEPGGYLATEYLNQNFAPAIARQVR
jgi:serine/threonine protein kinase/ABC-type enterochelin transport system substrate-binding protein